MTTRPSGHSEKHRVRDIFQRGIRSAKSIFHSGPGSRTSANHPGGSTALPHPVSSRSPSPALRGTPTTTISTGAFSQNAPTAVPTEAHEEATEPRAQSLENPSPVSQQKVKRAGRAAWEGLGISLQVLERSSEVFPPLKSAVSGFSDSLHIVRAAAENRDDYEQLASELDALVRTLNQYASEFSAEDLSGSIGNISLAIEVQVKDIKKQQNHSKARRILESPEDSADVLQSYRHIESSFRQLQNNVSLRILRNTREQLEVTIIQAMAPEEDARYNSGFSTLVKRRGCTSATREAVLADLHGWVGDPNAAKVYWMSGMAGTGKTTIAYSLCKWLEDNRQLGASFFCSRVSASCRNTSRIIPTIACQLSRYSPAFRSKLFGILKVDQGISKVNVVDQFDKLIATPLLEVKSSIPGGVVIVVDALDECDDTHGVDLVLTTLLRFAPVLPVKFFVASRPEPTIQNNMLSSSNFPPTVLRLHNIEDLVVKEDIKKYLVEALGLMPSPPSQEQIEELAKRAGKLFIYAATLVRYILPEFLPVNSSARLETMLTAGSHSVRDARSAHRYKALDELYSVIIVAAFNELLEEAEIQVIRLVLWTVVCAKEPMGAGALASLLGFGEQEILLAVQQLQSVLHVSDNRVISTLHASFPEYLLNSWRSRDHHCDESQHSGLLASRCFQAMRDQLRFNICDIHSSFAFDKDLPDFDKRITQSISPALFYACRFWSEHLQLSSFSQDLHIKLVEFLSNQLLFWMEVLNLKRCIAMGVSVIFRAQTWLHISQDPIATRTQQWIADVKEFVLRFVSSACTRSTPHLYLSALPFTSKSNWVYTQYWQRMRGLTNVRGTAIARNDYAALARWEANSQVLTVQFSPDGTRVVSGSLDGTIQIWDTLTGNPVVGPCYSSMGPVNTVAFAPDGTRIVSGDSGGSVQFWNALTGDFIIGTSQEYGPPVNSVAYSPDSTLVASGSQDGTIGLWDARSGNLVVGPLQTQAISVNSVAFSPDGSRVVSSAIDSAIQVWDAATGKLIIGSSELSDYLTNPVQSTPEKDVQTTSTPFQRRIFSVASVAFSPDGAYIVSGSDDQSVVVWNALTGDMVGEPLQGHIGFVTSVSFSPNGTSIASSSNDKTIRLWDASTRQPIAIFQGHTEWVNSVAFSPDGARLVSGSNDCTLRIWDTRAASLSRPPSSSTTSEIDKNPRLLGAKLSEISAKRFKGPPMVAFALDGAQVIVVFSEMLDYMDLAGNSPTGTILMVFTAQVWDVRTGDLLSELVQRNVELPPDHFAVRPEGYHPVPTLPEDSSRICGPPCANFTPPPSESAIVSLESLDGALVTTLNSNEKQTSIEICDANTGRVIFGPFELDASFDNRPVRSPDNLLEFVASGNNIEVRHSQSHTDTLVIDLLKGHTESVAAIAVSPGGSHLVSSDAEGNVRVWMVHTGSGALSESIPATESAPRVDHVADYSPRTPPIIEILNGDWDIGSDGWIMVNNIPILWVPLDFANCMPRYPHHLVIGNHGSVEIEHWDILLGERWSECYASKQLLPDILPFTS